MAPPGTNVRNDQQRQRDRQGADWQIDEEYRSPAEMGDERPSHGWAGDDRETGEYPEGSEGDASPRGRQHRQQDGHPLRSQDGGAKSLAGSSKNQLRRILGKPAKD